MNYKVGDKIIISKPSQEELNKWCDSWENGMDDYIGKEYIIDNINVNSFRIKSVAFNFPSCILNNPKEINYEIY